MFHSEIHHAGFLTELAIELLNDWPIGYRAKNQIERLALQGASLAREPVADQAIRDALEANNLEEARAILRKAQKKRVEIP